MIFAAGRILAHFQIQPVSGTMEGMSSRKRPKSARDGSRGTARPETGRAGSSPPEQSRWRQFTGNTWTVTVVGGAAAAVLAVVLTTVATGFWGKVFGQHNSGLAMIATAAYSQPAEFAVGFPSQGELTSSLRESSGNFQNYITDVNRLGGALVSPAFVKITLSGNRSTPVTLTQISVANQHCQAPLAYQSISYQGLNFITGISFNLDTPFPVALSDDEGVLSGPFFPREDLTLSDGDSHSFLIGVTTKDHFCQFSFELTFADGPPETVTNGGKPFAVTAAVKQSVTAKAPSAS